MTLEHQNQLLETMMCLFPDATVGMFAAWVRGLEGKSVPELHMRALIKLGRTEPPNTKP